MAGVPDREAELLAVGLAAGVAGVVGAGGALGGWCRDWPQT